jgi:hypothetical protein
MKNPFRKENMKNGPPKKRYIDIEQIDQQCVNMSLNLGEGSAEDYTFQDKIVTPLSIHNKFRNNSVISSAGNNTFLSSEMMS